MNARNLSKVHVNVHAALATERQQFVWSTVAQWFQLEITWIFANDSEHSEQTIVEIEGSNVAMWQNHGILDADASANVDIKCAAWRSSDGATELMLPCMHAEPLGTKAAGQGLELGFDPIGATFWGLSCWSEQHGQCKLDVFGRPTTKHLPWVRSQKTARFNGKELPMSHQHHWPWLELMWSSLLTSWGIEVRTGLTFRPTIDIDVAYKHLGRPRWKSLLLNARDLMSGQWRMGHERSKVLKGAISDPYDTYADLKEIHNEESLWWFVLASNRSAPHDIGLNPDAPALPALVESLNSSSQPASVFWHPGYKAVDDSHVRSAEFERFAGWEGTDSGTVRTHFLRGMPAEWWRSLEEMGIERDASLGWARDVGFRAGTSRPFQAYDVHADRTLKLEIVPIAVMDMAMSVGLRWSPEEAKRKLDSRMQVVAEVGGHWTSCWHNTSVSEEGSWLGWRATYVHMVETARRLA